MVGKLKLEPVSQTLKREPKVISLNSILKLAKNVFNDDTFNTLSECVAKKYF